MGGGHRPHQAHTQRPQGVEPPRRRWPDSDPQVARQADQRQARDTRPLSRHPQDVEVTANHHHRAISGDDPSPCDEGQVTRRLRVHHGRPLHLQRLSSLDRRPTADSELQKGQTANTVDNICSRKWVQSLSWPTRLSHDWAPSRNGDGVWSPLPRLRLQASHANNSLGWHPLARLSASRRASTGWPVLLLRITKPSMRPGWRSVAQRIHVPQMALPPSWLLAPPQPLCMRSGTSSSTALTSSFPPERAPGCPTCACASER